MFCHSTYVDTRTPSIREHRLFIWRKWMKLFTASIGAIVLLAIWSASAMGSGQTQTAPVPAVGPSNGVFRTTKAVNYRRARGSVKIHFQATELLQGASGEAKIQSKNN